MYVIDSKKTQKEFRERQKACEEHNLTREEYGLMEQSCKEILTNMYNHIDTVVKPACEKYQSLSMCMEEPLLYMLRNLDYTFGLVCNVMSSEDDPERFKQDRKILIEAMKRDFLDKKTA